MFVVEVRSIEAASLRLLSAAFCVRLAGITFGRQEPLTIWALGLDILPVKEAHRDHLATFVLGFLISEIYWRGGTILGVRNSTQQIGCIVLC